MTFRVVLDRRAARTLDDLDDRTRARITAALAALGNDPFRSRPGRDIRALVGEEGLRAVRIGKWRALYVVDDETMEVRVVLIAHRRSVYGR